MKSIRTCVEQVSERIAAAARRSGRDPAAVQLIAVTKTHPVEVIEAAIAAGLRQLGENRVQEAQPKIRALAERHPELRWHLLGHLQRNKSKVAIQHFHLLHTLDSLRLAETLNRHLAEGVPPAPGAPPAQLPVLLQVNLSGEASKEGLALPGGTANQNDLPALLGDVEAMLALPHLRVRGLMTIAPFVDDPQQVRPVFRELRLLRDLLARQFPAQGGAQHSWQELSMGMTADFEVAIEEGATCVRIGRALFGERA